MAQPKVNFEVDFTHPWWAADLIAASTYWKEYLDAFGAEHEEGEQITVFIGKPDERHPKYGWNLWTHVSGDSFAYTERMFIDHEADPSWPALRRYTNGED